MEIGFKNWLIKDADKWKPDQKKNFLQMMKSSPDQVKKIIAENLMDWATVYAMKEGEVMIIHSLRSDSEDLFAAYQEHFAKEIAAVS